MPHVLLHHLPLTRHISMSDKFGTQFHFHFETHISVVFPPVSPLTTWRMFQYACLTQAAATFPGPDHSQNLAFARMVCTDFCVAALKSRHAQITDTCCNETWHQGSLRTNFKTWHTYLSELLRILQRMCPHWSMHQLAPSSNSTSCSRLGKTHTLFLRAKAFTYCTITRSKHEEIITNPSEALMEHFGNLPSSDITHSSVTESADRLFLWESIPKLGVNNSHVPWPARWSPNLISDDFEFRGWENNILSRSGTNCHCR